MENSRQEFFNEFLFENVCLSQREGKLRCGGGKISLIDHFQLCDTAVSESNRSLSHHYAGFSLSESFSSLHLNCSK